MYGIFITLLILIKVLYTILDIYLYFTKRNQSQSHIEIENFNNKLLTVFEFGVFLLLIVIFLPFSGNNNGILISKHEEFLFFMLGVVGLLHIDYKFLLNIK